MRGITSLSIALASLAFLPGCVGFKPTKDPTRYYLLSSVSSDTSVSLSDGGWRIGIRTVEMPSYLNSSKIAVRRGPHEITYSNFNRWGEDINRAVARCVSEEFERHLEIHYISIFPWPSGLEHDYQVSISFSHFEGTSDGKVLVAGTWVLVDPASREILTTHSFRVEKKWDGQTYAELAAALSEAVRLVSQEIVSEIE